MRSAALAFLAAHGANARHRPPVWCADQLDRSLRGEGDVSAQRSTGHPALDAELPGGGWPAAGLIELLLPTPGCGELRLLAPVLGRGGALLWIDPPFLPYAPALAALGVAPDRLVIVTPAKAADAAWAAEQALRSGALSAVLWWERGQGRPSTAPATLRRLHLAAEEGRTPLFALRLALARGQSSPASLRLALEPAAPLRLAVDVFKRRGPPMAGPLTLALPGPAPRRARRANTGLPAVRDREDHAVVRLAPERAAA
jgi:hypothetical protein